MRHSHSSCTALAAVVGLVVVVATLGHPAAGQAPAKARAASGFIDCQGSVKPRREWIFRLRPGEQVTAVLVADGHEVPKGAAIAESCDSEGWARLLELKAQKRALDRAHLEEELNRLELHNKEERLTRLDQELEDLHKLWNDVEPSAADRRVASLRDRRDELAERVGELRLMLAKAGACADESLATLLDVQITRMQSRLASPVVLAPFAGRVTHVAPDLSRLGVGETVFELWDTKMMVRAEVLQHQLALVERGCRAEVTLDFSNARPVGATVERIESGSVTRAGEACPSSGVELNLDEEAPWLGPGMRVSVHIRPRGKG